MSLSYKVYVMLCYFWFALQRVLGAASNLSGNRCGTQLTRCGWADEVTVPLQLGSI